MSKPPTPLPGGVAIRAATGDDAAGIARVHIRSFLATYPHLPITRHTAESGHASWVRTWSRRLREGRCWWSSAGPPEPVASSTLVATANGRICGFVHLGPDPDSRSTGQILSLHVDPDRAGHGIGTRLMARAVATLMAAGYQSATLWVVADNDRARAFYARLGWHFDGSRRREVLALDAEDGDEVDTVRYRLYLNRSTVEGTSPSRPSRPGRRPVPG